MLMGSVPIEVLKSKKITKVTASEEEVLLECSDGSRYKMVHYQDCCEHVHLTNPEEALKLQDAMVLLASENNPEDKPLNEYDDSYTWTFFTIVTDNGVHILKWYGTSNGYYSESVDFIDATV